MNLIARRIHVSGVVQGVAFRHFTRVKARALGVRGFVQNLPDGSVEVWAEGAQSAVLELVEWLAHGPPTASVREHRVDVVEPTGAERFEVRREG